MTLNFTPQPDLQRRPRRLAVLGAPGSGKTRLCSDLQTALAAAPADTSALSICDDPPLAQLGPGIDRVLLMGLDLPPGRTDPETQRAADGQLWQMLDQAGLDHTVIYGAGAARPAKRAQRLAGDVALRRIAAADGALVATGRQTPLGLGLRQLSRP